MRQSENTPYRRHHNCTGLRLGITICQLMSFADDEFCARVASASASARSAAEEKLTLGFSSGAASCTASMHACMKPMHGPQRRHSNLGNREPQQNTLSDL